MGLEKRMISSHQALILITNLIYATETEFIPAFLAQYAGQDAWVAVLIAAIIGPLFGALVIYLGLRFPKQDVVEYGMELLGPWGGRALGVILGLFFFYVAGLAVRELSNHLVYAIMPETPLVVFSILYVIAIAYGVYLGLEVFARAGEVVFPLFLIVIIGGTLMLLPQLHFDLLRPVLAHPPLALLQGSLNLVSFYGEGIAILFLIPCLSHPEQAYKLNFKIMAMLTIPLLILVVSEITLFGPEETSRMIFPTFELVKMISIGSFFERIEAFLLAFWVTTVTIKVMLLYYVALVALSRSFNLSDYRPLVLPGALILVPLSILVFTDVTQARSFLSTYWNTFAITVEMGIPILLLMVAMIRKKGTTGKKGEGIN